MDALFGFLTHRTTVRLCRIGLGLIFLAAALAKIGDLETFAKQIHNFELLPVALENIPAIVLPWIELVAGVALVTGIRGRAAALICTAMLVVFTIAVVTAVFRGLVIDCGCFGSAEPAPVGWSKVIQNAGMIALGLVACLRLRD